MEKELAYYHKEGYSVIPINPNSKKPLIGWTEFQTRKATPEEITKWWKKWPDAKVAIVTGKISGLTIVDIDSKEAEEVFEEYVNDSFLTPTVKSPHGKHYYFKYCQGLSNTSKVLTNTACDIRNDGGYIIAPPSKNGAEGGYRWLDDCTIGRVALAEIPKAFKEHVLNSSRTSLDSSTSYIYREDELTSGDTELTKVDILQKGSRDDDLFHLANHLVKGRMPIASIRKYMRFFGSKCTPPFPPKEIDAKIQSAIDRVQKAERNLAGEVREWVELTKGDFSVTNCRQELTLVDKKEIKYVSKVLSRLVTEEAIERVGNRNGQFRRIESRAPDMDIFSVQGDSLPIKYPLGLDKLFLTMPKNLIVIAGTQDAGKTAFMLKTAAMNMNRGMEIVYLTSEMGEMELRTRLEKFDIPPEDWKSVHFRDCPANFQDQIIPDAINIIDFLEISDSFYTIGGDMRKIYDKLDKGICLIAIQKDFKAELGRGGSFSLEKPRLYVTMTSNPPAGGVAKIIKAKNWKHSDWNPNGRECGFKIRNGSEITQVGDWEYPIKEK